MPRVLLSQPAHFLQAAGRLIIMTHHDAYLVGAIVRARNGARIHSLATQIIAITLLPRTLGKHGKVSNQIRTPPPFFLVAYVNLFSFFRNKPLTFTFGRRRPQRIQPQRRPPALSTGPKNRPRKLGTINRLRSYA